MKKATKKELFWMVILILCLILFFATGCRSVQPVIVERVKIEYMDRLRIDSVYNRDTVNIYERGDTVYLQTIKWRERFKIDTVSVVKVDSIPYFIEVTKEVNVLTKWQKIRLQLLNVIILVIAVYVIIRIKR